MKPFPSEDKSFWGFKYALRGLWRMICTEGHFRFHICAATGTFMFTEYYDFSRYDYAFLAMTVVLVLGAEIINTAIEYAVDISTKEYSINAKHAKDISAAFVLVLCIFALATAYILFYNPSILFPALLDIFTRIKYIIFFVFTFFFVRGTGFKEKKDDK